MNPLYLAILIIFYRVSLNVMAISTWSTRNADHLNAFLFIFQIRAIHWMTESSGGRRTNHNLVLYRSMKTRRLCCLYFRNGISIASDVAYSAQDSKSERKISKIPVSQPDFLKRHWNSPSKIFPSVDLNLSRLRIKSFSTWFIQILTKTTSA